VVTASVTVTGFYDGDSFYHAKRNHQPDGGWFNGVGVWPLEAIESNEACLTGETIDVAIIGMA
jgi:hypothetical protein